MNGASLPDFDPGEKTRGLNLAVGETARQAPPRFKGVVEFVNASKFAGDHTARVPPVPIPNTEVKPRWADGTARVSVWEIR